jgi:hypothetical protein
VRWLVATALGLALVIALAGCNRDDDYTGIGVWRFGHSVRSDVKTGRCDPTTLSDGRPALWCYLLQPYKIAGKVAELSLYFLGTGDDAPLIEIQLQVRGCVEDDVIGWLRTTFGAQTDDKPKRMYWSNPYMWIAAFVPDEPGRCTLHFLPRTELGEINRLRQL